MKRGLIFRKNVPDFQGTPDITIKKYKIVIFIDSCFWHVSPLNDEIPETNTYYWSKKIERNMNRDNKVNEYYTKKGWGILRIQEHDLKSNFEEVITKRINFANKSKKVSK